MSKNTLPYELLNNSVMSRDEVVDYISDDFRVGFNELKKVRIYKYSQNVTKPTAKKIPHHRYNLFFENGELSIVPREGALRVKHITTELQILETYLNHKINFEIIENTLESFELNSALSDISSKLDTSALDGVIVGSIWNINFFINKKIRRDAYKQFFNRFDKNDMEKYITHRLMVSDIESYLLNGTIKNIDHCIFQEGGLPNNETYNYVKRIHQGLNNIINRTEILNDYLGLDYVFFNDLRNNTKMFDEAVNFPETQVFSNNLLTYQIVTVPGKIGKYLNISWIESSVLGGILEKLQHIYPYKEFFMYGKCGALEKSMKVGSFVAPKSITKEEELPIFNNAIDIPQYDFIGVDSPLMETKNWLKESLSTGARCVEMELYDIFKRIKSPDCIDIGYYVSDNLNSGFKLSNRFDFLNQRLLLSERIVQKIFHKKGHEK